MIDFPSSPTTGQQYTTSNGVTYVWDGVKWTTSGSAGAAMPLAINDNRIINGDMRIDQRNNGAVGTGSNVYSVDRWKYVATAASKGTWQRVGINQALGFSNALKFTSSSAYTPPAGDAYAFWQAVEADAITDFAWGTSAAQPVTLSFWAQSSLTGTFSGAIGEGSGTRGYPFTYALPTANVWVKVAITIPGDTGGTWTLGGNGAGLYVAFDLGSGSSGRAPAGAWSPTTWVMGANGAVNLVSTNGATFNVTGVKLEIGSVATPFNRQSLAKSLADCQRYYCNLANISVSAGPPAAGAGEQTYNFVTLPTTMRAAPTISVPTISSTNCSSAGALDQAPTGFSLYITALAAGVFFGALGTITASAEL